MSPVLDEKTLLKNRNPNKTIGPIDGLVGALIEGGKYFITSANQQYMLSPPLGPNRPLQLRSDCRYGQDDPIQWPQPFNPTFPHYSCIPRPTACPNSSIMWWNLTRDSFVPVESPLFPFIRLGKLARHKVVEINIDVKALLTRVENYMKTTSPARVPPVLGPIAQAIKHGLSRLESIAMQFGQMEFQVRDLQRCWLEAVGMLDYMEIYRPRMDATQGVIFTPQSPVADTIGTFTSDVRVAQDHFLAGLPCWFIRPAYAFTDQNILKICQFEGTYFINLDLHPSRSRTLAEGPAGTDAKHNAIHAYARNIMKYRDPFNSDTTTPAPSMSIANNGSTVLPVASSSTVGPIRTAHNKGRPDGSVNKNNGGRRPTQSSNSKNTHGGGRKKFEPLDSPFMPLAIPSWQNALKAVDTDPSRLDSSNRTNPHDGKYVFPEPGIFAGVQNELRRSRYFATWDSTKDVCIFRVFQGSSTAVPLSGQEWRDLLVGNLNGEFKGKKNQETQQKIRNLFADCLDELQVTFDQFMPPTDTTPLSVEPSEGQKVLWELSELNFRFELLALDKRASGTASEDAAKDRQEMICRCFPNNALIAELRHSTQGLASLNWQERLPTLLRLRALMRDWPEPKPTPLLLPDLSSLNLYTESDSRLLEDAVAQFYTQTFFNFFGRAAVIPTRLPHH